MLWSSLLDFHNAAACYSELSGPWHASMQLHLTSYHLKSSVGSSSCTFYLVFFTFSTTCNVEQMDLTFTFKENTQLPPDCQSFCRSQFFSRPKILRQRLRLFFCYQIFFGLYRYSQNMGKVSILRSVETRYTKPVSLKMWQKSKRNGKWGLDTQHCFIM